MTAHRTFLEKITLIHGLACGSRDDESYVLKDRNRLSRHYYDIAKLSELPEIMAVLSDDKLIGEVVAHSKRTFGNGWRKLDEAKPGSFLLSPNERLSNPRA